MENKKEYLKKYLNEEPKKKKKKVKVNKPVVSNPRIKIIDDDINVKSLECESEEEVGEEAPQIVEIIDETRKARWKKLEDSTENVSSKRLDSDSDLSPPRTISGNQQNSENLQRRSRYDTDSDQSPPRPNQNKTKTNYTDDDLSPLRNNRKNYESDSDQSPQRSRSNKRHSEKLHKKEPEGSDSENGRTSRKKHKKKHKKHHRKSESPEMRHRNKRVKSDSDQSPVRSSNNQENYKIKKKKHSRRHDSTSDESSRKHKDDLSSSRKARGNRRNDSDSDQSPIRYSNNQQETYKIKKKKHSKRHDSDSDESDHKHKANDILALQKSLLSGIKIIDSNSDQSPARYSSNQETSKIKRNKYSKRHDSESEESDHRLKDISFLKNSHRREKNNEKVDNEKDDNRFIDEIKKSKKESKHVSNVELKTVKKEVNNEDNQEKVVPETSVDENKMETEILSTPFARYKDDPELEKHLKDKEREGDPMLAYIRKKKSKNQDGSTENVQVYKGPPPPPNRFNINPGHKWDGVDRSNGYEKKYFDNIAQRKAYEELAYKWSVEDM